MIPTALAILVYGMISALLGTLLPDLSRRLSLTDGQNGTVALVQSLGLIAASLGTGLLIDRKGTKLALSVGLGAVTISLLSLGRAASFREVAASILVLGLGSGMVATGTNTAASALTPDRKASTLNRLNLFFGLGGLLTPLIGATWFAGNTAGLCHLVAALTSCIFVLHFARPGAPRVPTERGRFIGNRSLPLICVFLFLYVACEVGVWNWFAKYLVTQGVAEKPALRALSLGFALGIILGRLFASLIRFPALNVTLACSALMAITTFAMLQTADVGVAGLLVFCAGLAMAPVFPTTLGLIGDRFPVMTSTAIGIAVTSGWVGLAVSSRLIGAIASEPSRLKTALLVIPVFSVLMILVNLLLRLSLREPGAPRAPVPA